MSSTSELRKFTPPGVEESDTEAENLVAPEDLKKEKPVRGGGRGEAGEAKLMPFSDEGKIPSAKKLNKVGLDKNEQFRLQDEIDKMQDEMEKQIDIISKLWAHDKDQSKAEKQKEKIKEKFEPRIAELQNKLKGEFGEKENIETLMPQLKKQTEESEDKRVAKIKKEKEDKAADRFQKIPITPELKATQKKWAQKDLEDAYKKLVDAENKLTEAVAKRSNVLMRFFRGNNDPRELAYQQALKALEEASQVVAQAEKSAARFETSTEPKTKRSGMVRFGAPTPSGHYSSLFRTYITGEQRKAESKSSQPIVEKPTNKKPTIQAGEHKIIFKPEPAKPTRKVEVNLPLTEVAPETVTDVKQQLENYVKDMFFKRDDSRELILKNAALMERLADAHFQGESQILNKAILDTKEEIMGWQKLKLEERLKLEGAKFNDLAEGGKLAKRLKTVFKNQPENYAQFLALEDLFEANTPAVGIPLKLPTRHKTPPTVVLSR